MAAKAKSSIGDETAKRLDLYMYEGMDFGPYSIELQNPDKTPVDLTNVTVLTHGRTSFDQPDPPAIVFTLSVDAPNGIVTLSLPAASTQSLGPHYVWDLRITWATGKTEILLFGDIRVSKVVTQ